MKIDDKYKWLARDEDGDLYSFIDKPYKDKTIWDTKDLVVAKRVKEIDERFSFIKWEDSEPIQITDIRNILALDSSDVINKPSHYIGINGLEVETVLHNFIPKYKDGYTAHRVSSAIEYLLRSPEKNQLEDIKKAKQNLEQVIAYVENQVAEEVEEELDQLKGFLIGLSVIGETNKINTFYHGTNPND